MLQLGFISVVSYISFCLALGVRVRGNAGTQPADLPTSIIPSNEKTPSILSRSCLLNAPSVAQTFVNEINDLLDENLHNGTLTLNFFGRNGDPENSSAVALLGYLLSPEGDETRTTIREIIIPWAPGSTVGSFEYWSPEYNYNESQLLDFVARVDNLESFRWQDDHMPKNLLTAIEHNHPHSCLHYGHSYIDIALAKSPLLSSISARALDYCTDPSVWSWISKTLAASSSIRSLTVKSGTCGCVLSGTRQALDIYNDTRFPALEELRLIGYVGYQFDGPAYEYPKLHKRSSTWDRIKLQLEAFSWKMQRKISGTPEKTNLEAWHEAMDWTKLRVLELNMLSVNTLNSINWPMPNLISFRSDLGYVESSDGWHAYNEALSAFVSRLPTRLQSLGFRSFYLPFSLERIADIHGQSLKSLELRGGNGQCRWYLNDTELQQIREQFPALEHLEIDLDRNQTRPNSTLDTLASFPHLNHLTLWLKLDDNDYQLPLLTNSSATSLFHALRSHKNGTDLTHTTFYLGPYDAYPSRGLTGPIWSTGRLAKVECSAKRGASPEDGGCRFYGYDPSRPETANWHIRYWDESRFLFSLLDEPKD